MDAEYDLCLKVRRNPQYRLSTSESTTVSDPLPASIPNDTIHEYKFQ